MPPKSESARRKSSWLAEQPELNRGVHSLLPASMVINPLPTFWLGLVRPEIRLLRRLDSSRSILENHNTHFFFVSHSQFRPEDTSFQILLVHLISHHSLNNMYEVDFLPRQGSWFMVCSSRLRRFVYFSTRPTPHSLRLRAFVAHRSHFLHSLYCLLNDSFFKLRLNSYLIRDIDLSLPF